MRTYNGFGIARRTAVLVAVGLLLATVPGGCPSVTPTDNSGKETPTVNVPPAFHFVEPSGDVSVFNGQSIPINWYDTDPDNNALIQVYYDKDGIKDSGDEIALTATYEDPDGAADSYTWTPNNMLPGTYRLLAVIDDGVNDPVTVYLSNTITVKSSGPSLAMTDPAGPQTRNPGGSVTLQWGFDVPAKSATVTLFYDTDQNKANGTSGTIIAVPVAPGNGTRTHTWQIPALQAGQYYVGATLDDQEHAPVTVYAPGVVSVNGPALYVDSPAGPVFLHCAGAVPVKWRADKAGLDATVQIFYDTDGLADSGDEVVLKTVQETANQTSNLQQVSLPVLPPGKYYLGVNLDDGQNTPMVVYADGAVSVSGPALAFTQPATALSAIPGDNVPIRWTCQSGGTSVDISIFYDDDRDFANGTLGQISTFKGVPNSAGDSMTWKVPSVKAGPYYVCATLDDGISPPVVTYAPGQVDVGGPGLTLTQPATGVSVVGSDAMTVGWKVQPANTSVTVTIFYDNDKDYSNGTLGQALQRVGPQTPTGDTASWTIPALPTGTYYLCGKLDDGLNPPVVAYAPGQVIVNSPILTMTDPATVVGAARNTTTTIKWKARAGGSNVKVTLFYDIDNNFGNGTLGQAATWTGTPTTAGDSANWLVPMLPARAYYIAGQLDDGVNPPVTAYAPGRISVSPSSLILLAPTTGGNVWQGTKIPVQWLADTSGALATVTIFYDNDTNYNNGVQKITDWVGVPSPTGDSVTWTAPILPVGPVYIGARLDDGMNPVVITYASAAMTVPPPMVTVTQPNVAATVLSDANVTIKWTISQLQSPTAKIDVFYDLDTNPANGQAGTIASLDLTAGNTYTWNTSGVLGDPRGWYIGVTVTDDLVPQSKVTAYSSAKITLLDQTLFTRQLDQTEFDPRFNTYLGRTFIGLSPGGKLGQVVAQVPWSRSKVDPKDPAKTRRMRQPGVDFNGDGRDDFLMVAPTANPFYLERQNAGEAYLVHSDPATLFNLSTNTDPIPVSRTGSSGLHGAIFSGPAHGGSTDGISAVMVSPDVDGDGIPDLLFGMPRVNKIHQDEQDYDPWDQMLDALDGITVDALATGPRTYTDQYRNPKGTADPVTDKSMDWVSGSLVVGVAGSNAPICAPLNQMPNQTVIGLDHVGQRSSDPHPLVLRNASTIPNPNGMRMYSPAPFRAAPRIDLNAFYPKAAPPASASESSRFGESAIEADVDGDGQPEWVFTQPANENTGSDSQGWLYVMWPKLSMIWGTDLTTLPYASGDASITVKEIWTSSATSAGTYNDPGPPPVTHATTISDAITTTWTFTYGAGGGTIRRQVHVARVTVDNVTGNQVPNNPPAPKDTDLPGQLSVTPTSTPALPPLPLYPDSVTTAWSSPSILYCWPYAVAAGNYSMQVDVDATVAPAKITGKTLLSDARERAYVYPMFFDCVEGYNDPAYGANPAEVLGHLTGLANAGDFNGDGREDITIGAPNANPGGNAKAGCVFLVFGRSNFGDHSLSTVGRTDDTALPGIKIVGEHAGDMVGASQANAGDFDGDGFGDWIIGAPGYNGGSGLVAIIYGTSNRQGTYKVSDIGTPTLPGLILVGGAAGDKAGTCVAGLGDVDGDGYDDVGIVAPGASQKISDGSVRSGCGVVYLIYGGPSYYDAKDSTKNTMDLGRTGMGILFGKMYAGVQGSGTSQVMTVAPAGDIDNDGKADFLIGNPNYDILDTGGKVVLPQLGEVYLIRGGGRLAP